MQLHLLWFGRTIKSTPPSCRWPTADRRSQMQMGSCQRLPKGEVRLRSKGGGIYAPLRGIQKEAYGIDRRSWHGYTSDNHLGWCFDLCASGPSLRIGVGTPPTWGKRRREDRRLPGNNSWLKVRSGFPPIVFLCTPSDPRTKRPSA